MKKLKVTIPWETRKKLGNKESARVVMEKLLEAYFSVSSKEDSEGKDIVMSLEIIEP